MVTAPLYVAVTTGSKNIGVREAQINMVYATRNILAGPDTDKINAMGDRFADCHFSDAGLDKYAQAWFESISEHVG